MNDLLKKIIDVKKDEILASKKNCNEQELLLKINNNDIRSFEKAIHKKIQNGYPAIIAEIKKASPSKGILSKNFNPSLFATSYEENGAACISVLTDQQFFQGSSEYLKQVKSACSLPILRKDFIIDDYQILESRAMGADCILLIVSALEKNKLYELENIALELGMDVLVETHNLKEVEIALNLKTPLIGINNRNLRNFKTDIKITIDLINFIPEDKIIITESGINSPEDLKFMRENKVNAFLIGEYFMKSDNPGEQLKTLLSNNIAKTNYI
ncbi:indole-3-glycerol phosphate synthase TrpC [Candidatus Kinetoplastidibacterium crithidiae]|uniref:Indole-3-glycerol phosphate synthase n=1 Tax=Candidatus Kinetoplastidibacterium crithidiae TCC036E TaxID=1208918 RepID=M1LNT3_9PROT|nr:indole-3-glycerol phosphate synthase TrpC [Candidatus Kinetoplastibacterium crithidii]AFZ83064.1 indole-3-glycerol-phosphate synthase [Candidatus Kinetoplastibacterium crithidii (ex Angomonas deanei ATCC 30255)]AGF47342.1 indole-3-glycerol phosphate synthase [Candidatus Kinetoplastibacterium crithidii TCC036E]